MDVEVREAPFDVGAALNRFTAEATGAGAVVSFTGVTRDVADGLKHMEIEHYPGMTERALEEIRAAGQDLPVLILTARYELDARVEGLDLGADDYLVKPFAMEELMARCRALVRRRSRRPEQGILYADLRIEPASHSVVRAGSEIQLTPKVFSLLMLFIENKGRVLTRRVLEDHLYGWDGEAESNTLEVFVSQIRRKLGSDLIQTIRGVGYMLKRE